MLSKQAIQDQLRQMRIQPNPQLGQHFLIDPNVIETSLRTAQLASADTVLEIGPGLGGLTETLCQTVQRVIAIEFDRQFEPALRSLQTHYPNLEVIWADALKADLTASRLTNGGYSVVANLPYQITSRCLRRFLTQKPYPKQMVLLIQKEVAERVTAQPGQLSILGLAVQVFSDPEYVVTVPSAAFFPQPEVVSAIVALKNIRHCDANNPRNVNDPRAAIMASPRKEKLFFTLIRAAFAQKRKKLLNNLKHIKWAGDLSSDAPPRSVPLELWQDWFTQLQLSENARAQELTLPQWLIMVDKLDSFIYN